MAQVYESSAAAATSPWPGLAAYGEAERGCFFGRDTEVTEIADAVRTNRITVLHGPVGSGKSSLLAAGLAPFLRETGCPVQWLRLDSTPAAPAAEVQFRDALAALCASEARPAHTWLERWGTLPLAAIMDDPNMLTADWDTVPHCLLLDQFEEVFPFGRAGARRLELPALFSALADLTAQPPLPGRPHRRRHSGPGSAVVHVLVSLRSDFLPRLEPWLRQVPALEHRILLAPLDGPRAAEVLLGPRGEDGTPLVEPAAARRIVQLAAGRDDSIPLEEIRAVPPFLSLLCRQLSQAAPDGRIREEMVRTGSTAILHRFYEECLTAHPPAVREFIEARLISAAGRRESVPRAAMEGALTDAGIPDAADVIDDLLTRRIITVRADGRAVHVELAHDQLAEVVQPGHLALREAVESRESEVRTVLLRRDRREQWSRYLRNIRRTALAGIGIVALSAGWLTFRHRQEMAEAKDRASSSALRLQSERLKGAASILRQQATSPAFGNGLSGILDKFVVSSGYDSVVSQEAARDSVLSAYAAELEKFPRRSRAFHALSLLAEVFRLESQMPVDGFVRQISAQYPLCLPQHVLPVLGRGSTDRVEALAEDGTAAYIQQGGKMILLDVVTGEIRWRTADKSPSDAVFSPDGKFLCGSLDGKPGVWRSDNAVKLWQRSERCTWTMGPGQGEMTVWSDEARGFVHSIADGKILREVVPERRTASGTAAKTGVTWSNDGMLAAMAVEGEGIRIWSSRNLKEVSRLKESYGHRPVCFDRPGNLVWTQSGQGLCGWQVQTGKPVYLFPGQAREGADTSISRDGNTFAVLRGNLLRIYHFPDRSLGLSELGHAFKNAFVFWRTAVFQPGHKRAVPALHSPWVSAWLVLLASQSTADGVPLPLTESEWLADFNRLKLIARHDQSKWGRMLRQSLRMDEPPAAAKR